ncbi:MAG: bifunctional 3-deoxy-7-phosphoheptulonate synthase/chorismate mutase type II [Bacteroidales bacterium]|nr:bifunctional 3-deoxy-7-phosphoheptulonate synthase/chorismate mutase type II [Bacteroidales bacterium]
MTMQHLEGLIPIKDWFEVFDGGLTVISGPCSAESKEQVMETAGALSGIKQVKALRAGIWKARTRPESFEGVGEEGLEWLQQARQETGLLLAVEIASPGHLELALKYGVDMVWLGARTISNPFSVQAIADKLRQKDIAVLVKNPVHPDLSLWIGALERLYHSGIKRLAGVHRGFYPCEPTSFRNIPHWEILIELKRRYPHLPVLCDPSHIAGDSSYIGYLSQKALDLSVDGLMIETHPQPAKALSDAKQQITPRELKILVGEMEKRHCSSENAQFKNSLETLREKIDRLDTRMFDILAQRMKLVKEIAKYKKQNQVTILQMERWQDILTSRLEVGEKLGLSKKFLHHLLELIHSESIRKQTDIMNKNRGHD